jgi:hypothetical protein
MQTDSWERRTQLLRISIFSSISLEATPEYSIEIFPKDLDLMVDGQLVKAETYVYTDKTPVVKALFANMKPIARFLYSKYVFPICVY